jgi:hypothetical protein
LTVKFCGRLGQMHARLAEDHPAWDDLIEVAYVPAPALRRFKTEAGNIAIVSPGEPFQHESRREGLAAELVHSSRDRRCASPPVAPDADTGDFEGRVRRGRTRAG